MVGRVAGLLGAGPGEGLLPSSSFDSGRLAATHVPSRSGHGRHGSLRGLDRQPGGAVHPRRLRRRREDHRRHRFSLRRLPRRQLRLRHADLFPLRSARAACTTSRAVGWRRPPGGDAMRLLRRPGGLRSPAPGRRTTSTGSAAGPPCCCSRAGPVGGHDGRARQHETLRRAARRRRASVTSSTSGATTWRTVALVAGAARASSAPLGIEDGMSTRKHLIGLLLGRRTGRPPSSTCWAASARSSTAARPAGYAASGSSTSPSTSATGRATRS